MSTSRQDHENKQKKSNPSQHRPHLRMHVDCTDSVKRGCRSADVRAMASFPTEIWLVLLAISMAGVLAFLYALACQVRDVVTVRQLHDRAAHLKYFQDRQMGNNTGDDSDEAIDESPVDDEPALEVEEAAPEEPQAAAA